MYYGRKGTHMNRRLLPLVPLLGLLVMGQDDLNCGLSTRVTPKADYIEIQTVLDPVLIETENLKGTGWLRYFDMATETWVPLLTEPDGGFVFHDVLPDAAYKCQWTFYGLEFNCVALLQVGDGGGRVNDNFYVCDAYYEQKVGRKHCGERMLAKRQYPSGESDPDPAKQMTLNKRWSHSIPYSYYPETNDTPYNWHGDQFSRMISSGHSFYQQSHNPPTDLASTTSWYIEAPFFEDEGTENQVVFSGDRNVSVDIGACSVFLPWEWKDRDPNGVFTAAIGSTTGNRGLAELFLDSIIERDEPQHQVEPNAFLWVDAMSGVWPRENISPEFHWRINEHGTRQLCMKQYMSANSQIGTKPDHWYRFDQAFGTFLLEIFPFIGNCATRSVSMLYCGDVGLDQKGEGTFRIDEESIQVHMDRYPRIRVICNDRFVPSLINGFREGLAVEGQKNMADGVQQLIASFADTLGLQVRRIETTPTGMYLVTANDEEDPQYGVGDCRPDLQHMSTPIKLRPRVQGVGHARGITRF